MESPVIADSEYMQFMVSKMSPKLQTFGQNEYTLYNKEDLFVSAKLSIIDKKSNY